jgi:hypothetical protein
VDFIQSLAGGATGAAIITGAFLLVNTLVTRRIPSHADQTAAEQARNAAENAANDLILKLLDRANDQIGRYESILSKSISADAASALRAEKAQAVQERDRLTLAIQYLQAKAQRTGHVTYAEVLIWARNALDPDVPIEDFDRALAVVGEALPADFDDTIRT